MHTQHILVHRSVKAAGVLVEKGEKEEQDKIGAYYISTVRKVYLSYTNLRSSGNRINELFLVSSNLFGLQDLRDSLMLSVSSTFIVA